jgi:hypothetical protein
MPGTNEIEMDKERNRPTATNTSKAAALMAAPKPAEKSRRTLYLNDSNYRKLEKLCADKGRSPSEMVDALIDDFLSQYH